MDIKKFLLEWQFKNIPPDEKKKGAINFYIRHISVDAQTQITHVILSTLKNRQIFVDILPNGALNGTDSQIVAFNNVQELMEYLFPTEKEKPQEPEQPKLFE